MHGNAPQNLGDPIELTAEQRKLLRRDGAAVAARARELLPDGFVVGSELVDGPAGIRATVAVRPPGGSVVSAGFSIEEDADPASLAHRIAAGAALEAKNTPSGRAPTAR